MRVTPESASARTSASGATASDATPSSPPTPNVPFARSTRRAAIGAGTAAGACDVASCIHTLRERLQTDALDDVEEALVVALALLDVDGEDLLERVRDLVL